MKSNTAIVLMALAFLCGCATMGQGTQSSDTLYLTVACKKDKELCQDIVRRMEIISIHSVYVEDGLTEFDVHGVCNSDMTPMYKIVNLKDDLSIMPGVFEINLNDGSQAHPVGVERMLPLHGN